MRGNGLTGVLLLVIALLVGYIAGTSAAPRAAAFAEAQAKAPTQPQLANIQFSGSMGGFWTFNTRTGEVFAYDAQARKWQYFGYIDKVGEPLK